MKRYKISKFSQHMGISIDTIKHYQDCGILKPIIDSSNNYRYYNITHGERLIVSRKFRNIGFNIQDTADMISCLDGFEIKDKLFARQKELEQELEQLKLHYDSVKYLASLCDNFNNKAGSFVECTCPGYYFFRHTFESEFIENSLNPVSSLAKILMEHLPNTVKMLILPYSTLKSSDTPAYCHAIGLREDFAHLISPDDLSRLEYIPPHKALLYFYSKPHSSQRIEFMNEIYDELTSNGYSLNQDDIVIENAIDYYPDGIRYENYLIYFPLS